MPVIGANGKGGELKIVTVMNTDTCAHEHTHKEGGKKGERKGGKNRGNKEGRERGEEEERKERREPSLITTAASHTGF